MNPLDRLLITSALVGLSTFTLDINQGFAAEADLYCQTGTSSTGAPLFQAVSSTNPCPVVASVTVTPSGTTVVTGTVAVSGTVPVSGTIGVSGTVPVSGTVTTSGSSTVSGTVAVSGTVPVSGTIGVSGTVPVSGTVTSTPSGTTTVAGTVAVSGTIPVSGTVTSTGTVAVSGTVPVSGTVAVTQSTSPWAVIQNLGTTNGWTPKILNALGTTVTNVKTAAAEEGMLQCYNPNTVVAYVQEFNAVATAVSLGTTTPLLSIPIAPTSTGGWALANPGINFGTALSVATSTTATGSTAPGTALDCNIAFN